MADTLASLRAIIAQKDATIEEKVALIMELEAKVKESGEAPRYGQIYEGGYGNISLRTIARSEGEAIGNMCEMNPVLAGIGCFASPIAPVNGCEVVALLPADFQHGQDRRDAADKLRRKEVGEEQVFPDEGETPAEDTPDTTGTQDTQTPEDDVLN